MRLANLNVVSEPHVELQWWAGCPSTDRALAELREALADVGLGGVEVDVREIRTKSEAEATGFVGSPTILIDGADSVSIGDGSSAKIGDGSSAKIGDGSSAEIDDEAEQEPPGLTCRVYRRRDGRISPTPDPDQLREALRRAAARREVTR